ncbi:unnamed protein product [Sphacelaria rigidula]
MGVILASCERQLTFPALLIEIKLCSLRAGLRVQSRLRGVHCESGVEHGVLGTMNAMLSARIVRGSLTGLIFVIRFSLLLFVNMKSFFFYSSKVDGRLEVLFRAVDTVFGISWDRIQTSVLSSPPGPRATGMDSTASISIRGGELPIICNH